MQIEQVSEAVALLRAGVDAVLGCELTGLDGVGVASLIEEIDVARRRLDAADTRVLAVAEDRLLAGEFGAANLVDLLSRRLRIDGSEARRRVDRYRDLGPRRAVSGESLDPILPAVAAALRAGEIHARHADVVSRYCDRVERLPDAEPADGEIAEKLLLDAARHETPRVVARLGEELLARLDQDGTEPTDERIARRRALTIRRHADGSSEWRIYADAELTALGDTVFDTLASPGSVSAVGETAGQHNSGGTDGHGNSQSGDGAGDSATDAQRDPRSAAQRRHDALRDVLHRITRAGDLPVSGGTPTTVLAHVRLEQLHLTDPAALDAVTWDGRPDVVAGVTKQLVEQVRAARNVADVADGHARCGGYAVTSHAGLLSGGLLAQQFCEAEVDILVTSADGAVLAFGRSTRLATRAQRIALAGRDGGCCFPGCTRPASWCEAHHVKPWQDGGRTDLRNLCLVCPYHHRHFEQLGWAVHMNRGIPEWTPPPWIDPQQKPIRNRANHLPEFEFTRGSDRVLV